MKYYINKKFCTLYINNSIEKIYRRNILNEMQKIMYIIAFLIYRFDKINQKLSGPGENGRANISGNIVSG